MFFIRQIFLFYSNKYSPPASWFAIVLFLNAFVLSAQQGGPTCDAIVGFCSGNKLVFENRIDGEAQPGIDYDCLSSQPAPFWYYLKIKDAGDLSFTLSQFSTEGDPIDVDFICWGPFDNLDICNKNNLNDETKIDCSYSPSAFEFFSIENAQEDEFYILLITNFDQKPGFITLEQTNAGQVQAGSTDCSVLVNLGGPVRACFNEEVFLKADNNFGNIIKYQWFVDDIPDDGIDSFILIPTADTQVLTISNNVSGIYKVILEDEFGNIGESTVPVDFFSKPTANTIMDLFACEGIKGSGISAFFDTGNVEGQLVGDQTGVSTFYYRSDGSKLPSPLPNPFNNIIPFNEIITARISNVENTGCYQETTFELTTVDVTLDLQERFVLCIDEGSVEVGQDFGSSNYSYKWIPGGETTPTITVDTPGTFTVFITDISIEYPCVIELPIEVIQSQKPLITLIEAQEFQGSVTIETEGLGDYEYSLDEGPFQDSPEFINVSGGEHFVTVRDKNGCQPNATGTFIMIDYPRFFTPNGDGYHDLWQIEQISTRPESRIYIFDRFGRFIRQLSPLDGGWDGTFNGQPLPSSDYWFMIEYHDSRGVEKKFRSHFTLKR